MIISFNTLLIGQNERVDQSPPIKVASHSGVVENSFSEPLKPLGCCIFGDQIKSATVGQYDWLTVVKPVRRRLIF
jgi:hypothetical protein